MTLQTVTFDHDLPFDPTYGYKRDDLLQVPPADAPHDFDAFWRNTYEQAMKIPLNLEHRQIASPWPDVELHEVAYDSWDGLRVGGWFTRPTDTTAPIKRGVVIGHGYGGRESAVHNTIVEPQVTLQPCARGFHRSAHEHLPHNVAEHVVHGIESRETYLHRGCVVDYWLAGSALVDLEPAAAEHLHYHGGSFGGGIGAMMLPWDKRFSRVFLSVPSFGPHPLRITLPCTGSGNAVTQYHKDHPESLNVLAYYDSTVHAPRITCPTLVECALFDPGVPPPGQFAVYNALDCEKQLIVRKAAHFAYDGSEDDAALDVALRKWFSDKP